VIAGVGQRGRVVVLDGLSGKVRSFSLTKRHPELLARPAAGPLGTNTRAEPALQPGDVFGREPFDAVERQFQRCLLDRYETTVLALFDPQPDRNRPQLFTDDCWVGRGGEIRLDLFGVERSDTAEISRHVQYLLRGRHPGSSPGSEGSSSSPVASA
jgi:hypothetical protein